MTHGFAHRAPTHQGIAFRQRARSERRQFLDHFADCLADGGTVAVCAARLGKGKAWGAAALKEIRQKLGWEQTE